MTTGPKKILLFSRSPSVFGGSITERFAEQLQDATNVSGSLLVESIRSIIVSRLDRNRNGATHNSPHGSRHEARQTKRKRCFNGRIEVS